jgi:magnesium chelatase subunit D
MVEEADGKKVSGRDVTPLPAVVGQSALKTALLAVGADDDLNGLLIRGEKGTAKTTAVRGLTALLPEQRAVADCPYGCPPDDADAQCADCRERTDPPVETRPVPFVTLPLGASRERVTGALSVDDALAGEAEFKPGLLAAANRGVLYVDEANLLDDHLVDVLLDAAADGVNYVERDGVSRTHPAEFTLVGTMNPEEGDLRPQFRDRFALQVEVEGSDDLEERTTVVERVLNGFEADYAEATAQRREQLLDARDRLGDVSVPDSLVRDVAELCRDAGVDGHRADIATAKAARTLAALDGRGRVIESDVKRAAAFALPHRLKSRPFEETPDAEELIEEFFDDSPTGTEDGDAGESGEGSADPEDTDTRGSGDHEGADGDGDGDSGGSGPETGRGDPSSEGSSATSDSDGDSDGSTDEREGSTGPEGHGGDGRTGDGSSDGEGIRAGTTDGDDPGDGSTGEEGDASGTPLLPGQRPTEVAPAGEGAAPDVDAPETGGAAGGDGRTRGGASPTGRGAKVRTEHATGEGDVDVAATVRAAGARGSDEIEARDLRQSVRAERGRALVLFVVDASASMRGPMRAAKGVAIDLLRDAYQRRDRVAMVTAAGERADVVLPPTDSVDLAARHLKSLPTGDRTPLPAGVETAAEVLASADAEEALVVVVTDGRANVGEGSPTAATREAAAKLATAGARVLVVDAGDEDGPSVVPELLEATDGERIPLSALTPERVGAALGRAADGERGGRDV